LVAVAALETLDKVLEEDAVVVTSVLATDFDDIDVLELDVVFTLLVLSTLDVNLTDDVDFTLLDVDLTEDVEELVRFELDDDFVNVLLNMEEELVSFELELVDLTVLEVLIDF
jgi:hypothetical protein